MTSLFGWIPRRPAAPAAPSAAGRDLSANWPLRGGYVGAADLVAPGPPVASPDGRFQLWAAGEVFAGLAAVALPASLQIAAVRHALLRELRRLGPRALAHLNGEFQVALWDDAELSLLIACDRFGCLPLYWASTQDGFAFGGSVAEILRAPGVSSDPDVDAIKEAVTFGGFRLGARTNVRQVQMLRGGRALCWRGGAVTERPYWSWPPPPQPTTRTLEGLVEEAHALWQAAVRRRLCGAERPGNTLSGGLDSRAIMAEATVQGASWRALTYGLPRCDDARLARRAAERAGAEWEFAPLYDGDWLARRAAFIAATDGLVQLVDLMHFETLERQTAMMDVHVSGYLGDVVCGDTYGDVVDVASLVRRLPYSGVSLAWSEPQALAWARDALAEIAPAAARFAIFEHKFPQAVHRIFQAAQGRIRVRRPFLDHDLFEFFAGLDAATRARVYHHMLAQRYPRLFARLPHQRTNAPVLAGRAGVQARRVARFAGRRVRDAAARTGLVRPAPSRSYHDEERHWREAGVRAHIAGTILRPGSISADVFGRRALGDFLRDWFERGLGPAQTVGALFVFEHYHSRRAQGLRRAAPQARPVVVSPGPGRPNASA